MNEEKNNLPKATPELAREYDELTARLDTMGSAGHEIEFEELAMKRSKLMDSYDWFHTPFTDRCTGKHGLKDAAGNVIAPALYDDFAEYQSYLYSPHKPVIAQRNGKYGIIAGDGTGRQLCDFRFDMLHSIPFTTLYAAWDDGDEHSFYVIAYDGEKVCLFPLTKIYEPVNGIMLIQSGDKYGVIDTESYQCVLPEYDNIDIEPDEVVMFHKGDEKGYVTTEGQFVTLEQYEAPDFDGTLLCAYC